MFYEVLMEKLAKKRELHRNRVQVHAFAHKDNVPHILASFDGRRYNFPGGGMDGASFGTAARNEMLEEAGYDIAKARVVAKPKKYTMSEKWQNESLGRRGTRFKGVRNAIVHAELGKRNLRRYGREGDQMSGLKLYPLEEVANHMTWYANRVNRYSEPDAWSREDIRAAQELQRELKRRT